MGYWYHTLALAAARPVAFLLVLSLLLVALPVGAGRPGVAQAAPSIQIPPGQFKRRTISGIVDAVSASSISIRTKFGNIFVNVTSDTVINVGPEKNVGIDRVLMGDKAVVHLDRSPVEQKKAAGDETPLPVETTTATTTGAGAGSSPTDGGGTSTTTDNGGTSTTTDNGGTSTTTEDGSTQSGDGTTTDGGTATSSQTTTGALILPLGDLREAFAASLIVSGGAVGSLSFSGAALQQTTTDDGGGGTQTTTVDGGGTQTTTDDGGGTQTTTDDGGSAQTTTDDGGGTQTTTDDGGGTTETTTAAVNSGQGPAPEDIVSFRSVTALRITVVPSKATRNHQRGLETCKTSKKRTVVDEEGNELELEDQSGEVDSGDEDSGVGTTSAAVLGSESVPILTASLVTGGGFSVGSLSFRGAALQETTTDAGAGSTNTTTTDGASNGTTTDAGDGSGDTAPTGGTSNGTTTGDGAETADQLDGETCAGGGDRLVLLLQKASLRAEKAVIRATAQAAKIDERLDRLIAKLEAQGKSTDRITARFEDRKAKEQQRLDRTLARADSRIQAKIDRAQKRKETREKEPGEDKGSGPKDKGSEDRGPKDNESGDKGPKDKEPKKGGGSSSSGGGSSGGGGGSSGGGGKGKK